ncbi:MAG: hypothetical protein AB2L20_18095 [Mangrovibacterium sp.]
MKDTIDYIKEVFGLDLNIAGIPNVQLKALPFYIANEYNFWEGNVTDRNIVFAEKINAGHFTPDQYKKQLELLERHFNNPVVFVLPFIDAYKRNRLIQKQVNFVIANKQVFIPELLIDIKEYLLKAQKREYLKPVAQCLILYHLQKEPLNHFTYRQLANALQYPYLTITRAVENIQALNLCTIEGTREKTICFETDNAGLWEKALAFMKSPVVKKVFTDDEIGEGLIFRSNINALAFYTELNDEKQIYLAVHQDTFRKLNKEGIIKTLSDYDGKYCIEIWKYTPAILANNQLVDPLSVYLEFKDNTDERVQLALKTILRQQKW